MKRFALAAAVILIGFATTNAGALTVGASYLSTDAEFDSAVSSFDTDDAGYKVFFGFDFIKFFGIEASYRDLGTHKDTSGSNSIDAEIEAFDASVRGVLPLKIVSLFVKAGYANISTDGSLNAGSVATSFDDSDWELFYGAGIDVNFGEHLGVRAEWEQYDVDDSLNSLSLGAFFRF